MYCPSEEAHVASWKSVKEKYADIDGELPAFAWPGGYTLIYWVGDDSNLGEICSSCANKVADDPEGYSADQFIFRSLETYDEGSPIHCAHCDREMIATYGETEEKEH
jgi:hypothetical protein